MPKHVHVLLSHDLDTGQGVCRHCGPVAIYMKSRGASSPRSPRCGIGARYQRNINSRQKHLKHNLTTAQARAFKAGKSCAICGGNVRLAVDHCHETGRIRGVLCVLCNTALARFGDNLEGVMRLVDYLKEPDL